MFFGTVPTDVIKQFLKVCPVGDWPKVYVGCSGSFKVDGTLLKTFPEMEVHSNDVSLFSSAIGFLLSGQTLTWTFTKKLDWLEEKLYAKPYIERVAALITAANYFRRYSEKSVFSRSMGAYLLEHWEDHEFHVLKLLERKLNETRVASYFCGDFLTHLDHAQEAGAAFVTFPPYFRGDYESMFRKLHNNTEWTPPEYTMWDSSMVPGLLENLRARKIHFCLLSDQKLDGVSSAFRSALGKAVYLYTDSYKSSLHQVPGPQALPFRYEPVNPDTITRKSILEVVQVSAEHLAFLKNQYYVAALRAFTDGEFNYLVLIDGCVVGGFTYSQIRKNGMMATGEDAANLFLLADFVIAHQGRLSKLIPMLALSKSALKAAERKFLMHYKRVSTMAFGDKPVSMKYRGIYELKKRLDNDTANSDKKFKLLYQGDVTQETPQQIYVRWYDKYFAKTKKKASSE